MEAPRKNDITIRYTVYGFLTGLAFPVFSLLVATLLGETSFSLHGLVELHSLHPMQYLLDSLPLGLGLAGFYAGIQTYQFRKKIHAQAHEFDARIDKIHDFTQKLSQNQLEAVYEQDNQQDRLGGSLIKLRNSLKKTRDEQAERKKEDDQKNWVSEGVAKFAELMRMHTDDMEEFSFNIISNLVKYLDANQGGFYLTELNKEEGKHFSMKACYAYDRKKFADKKVGWGEGLIGTCAMERQSIYITDIPEGYLTITSGLGKANPGHLLIVPLMIQSEVPGIIEMASFHPFELYQIRFVEHLAESIAMTLSSLKSNIRTAELLRESRKQAEALALQEEQMRRSMDELRNTQEEAARQAEKFISFTNSVNHTLIRAEYETNGTLIYANTKFLRLLGYFSNTEVEGQHISMFIDEKDREWFNKIWDRLAGGGKHYEGYMKHMTRQGQDLWTMATYTCVRRDDGSVHKILFLAIDTTEQKKQSLDYEGQIEAINRQNIKAQFAPDGKFIDCNDLFVDTLKYSRKELTGMNVFDLFDKKDIENFNEIWENITKGIPYRGQLKNLTKYDDEKWFRSTYTAVHDMYGEVAKVIFLANEITNERLMEIETRKQTDKLKMQEEKLKLSGIELKKKLEETRAQLAAQYAGMEMERNRYSIILDNLSDIIVTTDQSGRIIYLNRAAEQFWQAKSKDLVNKQIQELFREDLSTYGPATRSLLTAGAAKITGEKERIRIKNGQGTLISGDLVIVLSEQKEQVSYTALFTPEG